MKRQRLRCWGRALLLAVAMLGLLLALLVLALDTGLVRERVRSSVSATLSEQLRGTFRIERIGGLSLRGLDGVDARVFDERGAEVARLQGLRARASLLGIAQQFLMGGSEPRVDLSLVELDFADVHIDVDDAGELALATAFLPREDGASAASTDTAAASGGPRVTVHALKCRHLWLHGAVAEGVALDADVTQAVLRISYSPAVGAEVTLQSAELLARALPLAVDPNGKLSGVLAAPPAGPTRIEVAFRGRALSSPSELDFRLVGDRLHARAALSRIPAPTVQRIAGTGLQGDAALTAEADGELPELRFVLALQALGGKLEASGRAVVSEGRELDLVAQLSDVDLSQLSSGAPSSRIAARLRASFTEVGDGDFIGAHRLDIEPSMLAEVAAPPLVVSGRDAWLAGTLQSRGGVSVMEPGAVASGAYEVSLRSAVDGRVAAALDARISDPPRLAALGLRARGAFSVSGSFDLKGGGVAATASLGMSYVRRGSAEARDLTLDASLSGTTAAPRLRATAACRVLAGSVQAQLELTPKRRKLELTGRELAASQLARLAGFELPRQLARGKLELAATAQGVGPASNLRLGLQARADFGPIGVLDLSAQDLQLPHGPFEWASLGALRGSAVLKGAVLLDSVSALLAESGLSLAQASGRLRFELSTQTRAGEPRGAEVALSIDTEGLRVVEEREDRGHLSTTGQAVDAAPLAFEGMDLHLALRTWPRTGEAVGTALVRDPVGTLLELQGETQLTGRWYRDLARDSAWTHHPVRLRLQVPARRLGALPAPLRSAALQGRLSAEASLDGTFSEPRAALRLQLKRLRARRGADPLDLATQVDWAPDGGKAQLVLTSERGGDEVGRVASSWHGDPLRSVTGRAGAWGADIEARFRAFPLDAVPMLVERQIAGKLSGELSLKGLGDDPRLEATLSSSNLSLASIPVQKLTLQVDAGGERARAGLQLEAGSGTARATLEAGLRRRDGLFPAFDRRGKLSIDARQFRVETLAPVLRDYVSELTGVLDVQTSLAFTDKETLLSGSLQLVDGTLQIPTVGQRFSDITARVVATDNRLRLQQLTARGSTGSVSVDGWATLANFDVREAEARLTIDKGESLPVTLEGVELGEAWGNLTAHYAASEAGRRSLSVRVQKLHFSSPETHGYDLQSLEPAKDVYVGMRRADGHFVELPTQPLEPDEGSSDNGARSTQPLTITVELGDEVVVERGRSAEVLLGGRLQIVVAERSEVNGRIELRRGKLDVQGKTFEIEHGVVTFAGGDPANPDVAATARWDAPGYAVYAEYTGDVKNGRIRLHSEPPLSEDQLANLLLFGSPDGSVGGGRDANAGALALGVVGDTAARGLTRALDNFTNLDVSARIDTTQGSARPELVLRLSPRASAKVSRALGQPLAGESPDRTFLTLELRLMRSWILSALVGDRGASALDLIWRRRY